MSRYVYDLFRVRVGESLVLYVMFFDWMYALNEFGWTLDLLGYDVMAHFMRLGLMQKECS